MIGMTGTLGILAADYTLAAVRTDIEQWCARQQLPPAVAQALAGNGAARFHHLAGETLVDLGRAAIERVLARAALDPGQIDAMVLCHTSPCNTLPAPFTLAGELRAAARLARAYVFSIAQQQCVSPLHALRVLDALFARRRDWRHALVVGVDTIMREDLRAIGDAGVHSDGASALLLGRDARCRIRAIETYNDPRSVDGIGADGRYTPNDHYLWSLVSVIRRVAKAAKVAPAQFASILPHNVNLPAWQQAMDTLRIPRARLFDDNFARIGHVFGSDVAINLADSGALERGGHHLAFASGIGGAFGGLAVATETTELHDESSR